MRSTPRRAGGPPPPAAQAKAYVSIPRGFVAPCTVARIQTLEVYKQQEFLGASTSLCKCRTRHFSSCNARLQPSTLTVTICYMGSVRRIRATREAKRAAWHKAGGRCEACGKSILVRRYPVEIASEPIRYKVHVWNEGHRCWRCGAPGRFLVVLGEANSIERFITDRDLGEAIRRRFPWFRPAYSETMEMSYYANHCENCDAFHGGHYVFEALEHIDRHDCPDHSEEISEVVDYTEAETIIEREYLPYVIRKVNCSDGAQRLALYCGDCDPQKSGKKRGDQ